MDSLNQEMIYQLKILSENKDGEFFLLSEKDGELKQFLVAYDLVIPNEIVGVKKFFKKVDVDKFSPDAVNSNLFWSYIFQFFPLLAITSDPRMKTIEEADFGTLSFSNYTNAFKYLLNVKIYNNNKDIKLLEIGGGYGNIYNFLKKYDIFDVDKNYFHVDVVKNFKHNNFFKTNGCGLPKELMDKEVKFDVIYSFNVFQHLSQKQKMAYYYSFYDKLEVGGEVIIGIFLETEENKNEPFWNYKDEFDRSYCKFFNQFTLVDRFEEFKADVLDAGFSDLEIIGSFQNYFSVVLKK